MTDFQLRLDEVIRNYALKHGRGPKSISISHDLIGDLYRETDAQFCIDNKGRSSPFWRGITFKFVYRKNYMEAFPRFKSSTQYFDENREEWENY